MVDLPHPLGPSIASMRPASTRKVTSWTMTCRPYDRLIPRTSSTALPYATASASAEPLRGRRASPTVRCVDVLLDGLPPHDADRLRRVSCLSRASAVQPLDGGITNRNYRVRCARRRPGRPPLGSRVVRPRDRPRERVPELGGRGGSPARRRRSPTTCRARACSSSRGSRAARSTRTTSARRRTCRGSRTCAGMLHAGPRVRERLRHVRDPGRGTSRSCASAASGCRRGTSSSRRRSSA